MKNSQTSEIKNIAGEELVKRNSGREKNNILIIDARSPEEYKAGHLPNAINMHIDELTDRLGEIEDLKEFPIITYCDTGNRSGQAAEFLVKAGFVDVTIAPGVKEFEYALARHQDVRGAVFEKFIDENKDDVLLIDVRPALQVEDEGMIEGATNIPLETLGDHLEQLPTDKTIALYCNTGTRSGKTAEILGSLGYEKIVNSIEGVKEYPFVLIK